ncbi:hypothetical protein DFJ58DRAFT_739841 [Suillus subalutaceus]|uniref:uncharacterized protein n=1 Tax=Suillus subalutaceus TaxID=48586 RepID=UPI001B873DC2|nr:uncharacterized protein DFJ58DRAFT_739841 [Suillus subalutaceus]KAG1815848.1 hypothetical protein DFJ58DRAFT_739841 [Suillus subalutaceus]
MTDQTSAHIDAPKPGRPCARPVMKAVKATGSQASAEIAASGNRAADIQGRDGWPKCQLAAGADVEDPASEEEMEEVPRAHKKKGRKIIPVKMPVRDAIQATRSLISNGSMEACDDDHQTPGLDSEVGCIPGWISNIPTSIGSKPSSKATPSTTAPSTSNFPPSSRITKGSTISSGSVPLTSISTSDAGANVMGSHYTAWFKDGSLGYQDFSQEELDLIEEDIGNDGFFMLSDIDNDDDRLREDDKDNDNNKEDSILLNTSKDQFNMDTEVPPAVVPLVKYKSNSDSSMDSDLQPRPSGQPPPLGQVLNLCSTIKAIKQKLADFEDDLSLSSDVEFVGQSYQVAVKKEESEPMLLRQTSATGVSVTRNAAVAKKLKPSITDTHSASMVSSQATPGPMNPPTALLMQILARLQYRMKNLPGGVWLLKDAPLCIMLQSIWNTLFTRTIPHTVTNDRPVIGISSATRLPPLPVIVLANFMFSQDNIETDEDCTGLAKSLRLAFLYGNISEEGKGKNPFQSDLIIQVLVHHRCSTWGTIDVPGTTTMSLAYSRGALALSTAAACFLYYRHIYSAYFACFRSSVPSILSWTKARMVTSKSSLEGGHVKVPRKHNKSTDKESTVSFAFSDANYRAKTRSYMTSITRLQEPVIH